MAKCAGSYSALQRCTVLWAVLYAQCASLARCLQKDVAVKIMKIKPGAKQESLTELPYTEAAIAGICIHANIVQTMYSDLMPVLDSSSAQEGGGSFWSKAKDDRASRSLARSDSSVKEWQVRMVMEICDLGAAPCKPAMLQCVVPRSACVLGALLLWHATIAAMCLLGRKQVYTVANAGLMV